jgi:hypothetical protein
VREKLIEELKQNVPDDYKAALAKPEAERTANEKVRAQYALERLEPPLERIANEAPRENLVKARRIVREIAAEVDYTRLCRTSRRVVNFEFWRDRCLSGSTEVNARARKLLYEANALYAKPDLQGAHDKFEESFAAWAQVFKQYPTLYEDADNDDIVKGVETYSRVREQLDLRDTSGVLPADFPLSELLKQRDRQDLLRFMRAAESAPAADAATDPPAKTEEPGSKSSDETAPAESTSSAEKKADAAASPAPAAQSPPSADSAPSPAAKSESAPAE